VCVCNLREAWRDVAWPVVVRDSGTESESDPIPSPTVEQTSLDGTASALMDFDSGLLSEA
jgi:hypothetical protein